MREIDFAYRTMFSELVQRSLDAAFEHDFPTSGWFSRVPVKGRDYWYFDERKDGRPVRRYVGPDSDPDVAERVAAFGRTKSDLKARRKLVSTLVREAGLQAPERLTGDIVEALAGAGLFRLRGVLVGTVAYQCYQGHLGVRLPSVAMQTSDADFAQFQSISAAVGDSLPPILDVLGPVDPSFREIPHRADDRFASRYANAAGFQVEFLTPNRGSDDNADVPAPMPALGGAAAQSLRFLDFLIRDPVRSVMLHKSGVPVTIPAPERFAVHKLIVAARRRGDPDGATKSGKDARQAELLMRALVATRRTSDLAHAYAEAHARGPAWREALRRGFASVEPRAVIELRAALARALPEIGEDPAIVEAGA